MQIFSPSNDLRIAALCGEIRSERMFRIEYENKDLIKRDLFSVCKALESLVKNLKLVENETRKIFVSLFLPVSGPCHFLVSDFKNEEQIQNTDSIVGAWISSHSLECFIQKENELHSIESQMIITFPIEVSRETIFSYDYDNSDNSLDYSFIEKGFLDLSQSNIISGDGEKLIHNILWLDDFQSEVFSSLVPEEYREILTYAKNICQSVLGDGSEESSDRVFSSQSVDGDSGYYFMRKFSLEKSNIKFASIKKSNDALTFLSEKSMLFLGMQSARPVNKQDQELKNNLSWVRSNSFRSKSLVFSKTSASLFCRSYNNGMNCKSNPKLSRGDNLNNSISLFIVHTQDILEIGKQGEMFTNHSFISFPHKDVGTFNVFCISKFTDVRKHFKEDDETNYKTYTEIQHIIKSNSVEDIVFGSSGDTEENLEKLSSIVGSKITAAEIIEKTVPKKKVRLFKNPGKWSVIKINSLIIMSNEKRKQNE